ncbi:MAG: hypothetical protein V2I97_07430 [Desulfococcaceae bacterium]|jgi:hypothetical protein|nr:hypothetical protein [Desulfococcaceae bacterium]
MSRKMKNRIEKLLEALELSRASQIPPPRKKEEKKAMNPAEEAVSNAYTALALKKMYSLYLRPFADEKSFNIRGKFSINKLKKADLVKVFAGIFSNEAVFQRFLGYLPKDVRGILDIIVWEGGEHNTKKLKKKFGSEIVVFPDKNYRHTGEIQSPYQLFQNRHKYGYRNYEYSLYLEDGMRKLFQKYMEPPDDYHLHPLKKAETTYFFQDNGRILNQIILFLSYIQQGNLKFSKNGDKVLITSIRQMCQYCNIDEFYPDSKNKDLQNIRTQLLTDFLLDIRDAQFEDPLKLMRVLTDELLIGEKKKYKLRDLLWHIKGLHNLWNEDGEIRVRTKIQELLRKLPLGKWISMDNISKYCICRHPDFDIINRWGANHYLWFTKEGEKEYYGNQKINISEDKYNDALLIPFIKGFFFLCASLGIVDIAYELPENEFHHVKGKKYLSVFDGLAFVKLSELGAHLLGLKPDYKAEVEEESARIVLDEQRLFIHLEGKNSLKSLALEKIGDKISESCFKINYQTFLKECSSKQDIRNKIMIFREQISAKPPQIWEDFISDIMNKINPLSMEKNMKVYQIKPDDELISLIAKDEILKKYILKAENFRILIESRHLSKVKNRLEEFGYFIDKL